MINLLLEVFVFDQKCVLFAIYFSVQNLKKKKNATSFTFINIDAKLKSLVCSFQHICPEDYS